MPPFRADHVGSLLRPARLHEARAKASEGRLAAAELRAIEDACIRDAIALQEAAGINAVTDGEFRRGHYLVDFLTFFLRHRSHADQLRARLQGRRRRER